MSLVELLRAYGPIVRIATSFPYLQRGTRRPLLFRSRKGRIITYYQGKKIRRNVEASEIAAEEAEEDSFPDIQVFPLGHQDSSSRSL
jgi:hypothetical protein